MTTLAKVETGVEQLSLFPELSHQLNWRLADMKDWASLFALDARKDLEGRILEGISDHTLEARRKRALKSLDDLLGAVAKMMNEARGELQK